jgi:hypothetical protein
MIDVRSPQGGRSREQEGIEAIVVTPRLPMAAEWLRRQRIVALQGPAAMVSPREDYICNASGRP